MMMSWSQQLVRIYAKGVQAARDGRPRTDNPYVDGYRGHGTYAGGNLQAQRRKYWYDGYDSETRHD